MDQVHRLAGRTPGSHAEPAVRVDLVEVPEVVQAACPSVDHVGLADPACVDLVDPVVETLDAWVVCSSLDVDRLVVHACLGVDRPDLGDHVVDPGLGDLETVDTT